MWGGEYNEPSDTWLYVDNKQEGIVKKLESSVHYWGENESIHFQEWMKMYWLTS